MLTNNSFVEYFYGEKFTDKRANKRCPTKLSNIVKNIAVIPLQHIFIILPAGSANDVLPVHSFYKSPTITFRKKHHFTYFVRIYYSQLLESYCLF